MSLLDDQGQALRVANDDVLAGGDVAAARPGTPQLAVHAYIA